MVDEEEKFAAFRRAHAALAASGTVTLELALSGVPMVVAYRVDPLVKPFKWALARINSFVLPNLIIGANPIPEFLDRQSSPERLAAAVLPLFADSPERARPTARLRQSRGADGAGAGNPERPRRRYRAGDDASAAPPPSPRREQVAPTQD